MKHSSLYFRWFLINFLSVFPLCIFPSTNSTTIPITGNETDRLALLDFKNRVTFDPLGIMSSWNDSLHFCQWEGITCNSNSSRVMILSLRYQQLVGSIPPSIGNLTFLTGINLRNNSFRGEIPQEFGRLLFLRHLNLSTNSFGGKIPTNITHCVELTVVVFSENQLVGVIPHQLSSLSKLVYLLLATNYLTGNIPPWIGNFSSLSALSLTQNSFQGSIPSDLGRLSNLEFLQLYDNKLSGTIPLSIFNITSIYFFSVTQNQLEGQIPADVGLTLPNLEMFLGGVNFFTGEIPISLPNASSLKMIDFGENSLTGTLPTNLGTLQSLSRLNFDKNSVGSGSFGDLDFLTSLGNCSSLEVLGLGINMFGGEIPNSIANLSTGLQMLTLGSNMIQGRVPNGIGNLVNLTLLGLELNYLNGSVPHSVGKLRRLEELNLNYNGFSGPIPSSIGNLTLLSKLFMEENKLEGSIPPTLGNCRNLLILNRSSNHLNGSIPKEVVSLSSLSISLAMANNSLSGPIPFEVCKLVNLKELHISENKLSSKIPNSLSRCLSLESLLLSGNFLQGSIPESLRALRGVEEMDFSRNNFSGKIPEFLGKFSILKKLNLSFNNLEGKVPSEGIFRNSTAISLIGNNKLCGGVSVLHLPECSDHINHSPNKIVPPKVVFLLSFLIFLITLLCFLASCYLTKKPTKRLLIEDSQFGISYLELLKSTDGFSKENLVGSGSFGSVYKGILHNKGEIVAVKVLNLQKEGAFKSFIDECTALRNIRHRNLLNLTTACWDIDHLGNEFRGLVFNYMSNGNLDQWLHPMNEKKDGKNKSLDTIQRLNIAIDVALALDYIHHHCQTPIVHCDLKPSNVLLDDGMNARVGDFGLASFLFELSKDGSRNQSLSAGLKGSIGYTAPENGIGGKLSALGDVYSYGILLLEMFTRKRPTDEIFKDGLTIRNFVGMALPEGVRDIIDPSLLDEKEDHQIGNDKEEEEEEAAAEERVININDESGMEECLVAVWRTGLCCSNPVARRRMPTNIVVHKMHEIRESFLRFKKRGYQRKTNKIAPLV